MRENHKQNDKKKKKKTLYKNIKPTVLHDFHGASIHALANINPTSRSITRITGVIGIGPSCASFVGPSPSGVGPHC
jgi:hypothetical protein